MYKVKIESYKGKPMLSPKSFRSYVSAKRTIAQVKRLRSRGVKQYQHYKGGFSIVKVGSQMRGKLG